MCSPPSFLTKYIAEWGGGNISLAILFLSITPLAAWSYFRQLSYNRLYREVNQVYLPWYGEHKEGPIKEGFEASGQFEAALLKKQLDPRLERERRGALFSVLCAFTVPTTVTALLMFFFIKCGFKM